MRDRSRIQQLSFLGVPRQQWRQLPKRPAPSSGLHPWLALIAIRRPQHHVQPGSPASSVIDDLPALIRNAALSKLIPNRHRMTRPVPRCVIRNPLQITRLQSPSADPRLQDLRLLQVAGPQPRIPVRLPCPGALRQITLVNRKYRLLR